MLCTNCGQAIEEGVPFCTNCGAPAAQASAAPPTPPSFAPSPPSFTQAPPTYPAMGGYGPGWQPPQAPPPAGRNRTGLIVGSVVAAVVLLAGLGVGLYFGLRGDGSDNTTSSKSTVTSSSTGSSASTSTTEEVFAQKEGEIFLEPVGTAGPDSFGGETFVPAVPAATPHIFTTTSLVAGATTTVLGGAATTAPGGATTTTPAVTTTTAGGGVQVVSYGGGTPALYGGSKDKQLVDKEGQLTFFENNPDKAAAFCAALNADPTFKWSGGTQIQPSQLRDYFAELTPMMLTRDTRVTNNGYRDGKPTPRQSVLQKGQMVLVDQYGVPRVRCECGNPLSPPKAVQKTPVYTGPKWPDFDPTTIIVVQPTTVVINIFVVIDIDTGEPFDRPTGTEGTEDVAHETTVWQLDVEMVWDDAENQHHFTANWTGVVTLNPDDGSLSGEGAGQWHVEGACWEGATVNGHMTADGFFSVELTGQLDDSASGKILTIFPAMADFSIDASTWDPPTGLEDAQADFESSIESLVVSSFNDRLEFPPISEGPMSIDLAVGDWAGSATFAPYEE
jgi:hypothetical protein